MTNTHIMRSNVNVAKPLRFTFTNTLHILQQNELKSWIEHLQQRVPVPDTSTTIALTSITTTSGQSNLTEDRIVAADGWLNRILQVAPMCPPIWAHWRHLANAAELLNLCFLRPTQVHNPNSKSIGSAAFAQLTAECHWVHWRHLANMTELMLPSAT